MKMSSSNGRENAKMAASIDSLKLSSVTSSKHASSESVLSRKDKESLQMQECKKKLLANEPQIIIRDENVVLRSPPQKKIVMPPNINADELAASTPTQRNWRGILIALLVIAAVLGLIVFSIALLTPAGDGVRVRGRRVTRAQVLSSRFKAQPFNGSWISDDELVIRDRWGGLSIINMRNLTARILMNNSTFRELNAVDFKVSPDLKFVLLISDVRKGWRHTRLARYHVYDVINRNKIPISPIEDDRTAPLLQLAEWSPTGSSLVFVHDNDIYYKPKVLKNLVCRITNTGVPGVIFNGVPDFLYETEVLRMDRALWFSADGQHLLYATYNDTLVGEHKYVWYGLDLQEPPPYPTVRTLRYPKANTNNPVVTVYVVSLKTPKFLFSHALQFTSQIDKDWYVRWTSWLSERQVVVLLLNRAQNVSIISICSALQYSCQDLLRDESGPGRWSGLGGEPSDAECGYCGGSAVTPHSSRALFSTAPVAADRCHYRHVVRVTQDSKTPLTHGNWEVTQLLGWDDRRRFLYVMGTVEDRAGERHLYRIFIHNDTSIWPTTTCVTCPRTHVHLFSTTEFQTSSTTEAYENVTSSDVASIAAAAATAPTINEQNDTLPKQCLYNRIIFSKNFSYYVQECLGPSPPASWIMSVSDNSDVPDTRRMLLSDGELLRQRVEMLAQPQPKVFRVEVQAGRAARVRLLLPPGFRETDDLPLPLVLQVDASPGSQLVSERFNIGWGWYLAAARNLIVAQIDARGSGYQGEDLRTEVYRKLLSVDVEDQMAVLTYLRDNLKMVDSSRIAVWGAGYGAAAALSMAADDVSNITRCVAAVCPLADLQHHNSYWSERYSGSSSPHSAVWRRVSNIPPRAVLLAHSTADLTHTPQHALLLARAMVDAQATYTHHVYPDEGHDLEHSSLHLHRSLEDFFDECFGPVEVADWDVGVGGFFPFRD